MNTCDRCGRLANITMISMFNSDVLCAQCKNDERMAPNYKRACEAEENACRLGDFNFKGIGLTPEDVRFLLERREARHGK